MTSQQIAKGHYDVTIHLPVMDPSLGNTAEVRHIFQWDTEKRPSLQIYTSYGTDPDQSGSLAYGLGATLREHEESHQSDLLKILENRQPPMVQDDWGAYHDYMRHTESLLNVCSSIHTDQQLTPFHPDMIAECKRILDE